METKTTTSILWRQVWGLAALQVAISLGWLAYDQYQGKLLTTFGFLSMAGALGLVKGLLGAIIEPLMGGLSDRLQQKNGSRFLIIAVGVTIAGLVFVTVAIVTGGNLPEGLKFLVPALMVLWLAAMAIFHSPALAILRQCAPTEQLPQAMAILNLVSGLVGAATPLLGKQLEILGPSYTFLLGGIVLVLGATVLRSVTPKTSAITITKTPQIQFLKLGLIFGTGLGVGFAIIAMLAIFAGLLTKGITQLDSSQILALILFLSALLAKPLGGVVVRIGNISTLLAALGGLIGLMTLSLEADNFFLASLILLGFAFVHSLVFNSAIPFALTSVPPGNAGLGIGSFFGGFGVASALITLLGLTNNLNTAYGLGGSATAFLLTVIFTQLISRNKPYTINEIDKRA